MAWTPVSFTLVHAADLFHNFSALFGFFYADNTRLTSATLKHHWRRSSHLLLWLTFSLLLLNKAGHNNRDNNVHNIWQCKQCLYTTIHSVTKCKQVHPLRSTNKFNECYDNQVFCSFIHLVWKVVICLFVCICCGHVNVLHWYCC